MKIETLNLRSCVGIVLLNRVGRIFIGERADRSGQWQMPQGGILPEEEIETAAQREMREEIGTDQAEILAISRQALVYHFPQRIDRPDMVDYDGQKMRWVLARYLGRDADIRLDADAHPDAHQEFLNWRWADPADVLAQVVAFKRPVYAAILEEFADQITPQ